MIEHATKLPIGVDTHVMSLAHASELALRYRITTYDAAYLDLSIRRELVIATLDGELVRAAREAGRPVLTNMPKPKRRTR